MTTTLTSVPSTTTSDPKQTSINSKAFPNAKTFKSSTKSKSKTLKINFQSNKKKSLHFNKRSPLSFKKTKKKTPLSKLTLWAKNYPKTKNSSLLSLLNTMKSPSMPKISTKSSRPIHINSKKWQPPTTGCSRTWLR